MRDGIGRALARGGVAGLLWAGLATGAAFGQDTAWPAGRIAQAETPRIFDIAPQPLIPALIRFTDATGIQLFFDATMARDLTSPGLRGSFTTAQALDGLLAGTGLTYRFTNPTTVTLERRPAVTGGVTEMPPVQVQGTARPETAWGPADGYVAHRSATGTKTDTPIIETPQSISVISRAEMDAQKPQSVSQALRYTAGVTSDNRGPVNRYDVLTVRGFGGFYLQHQDGMKLLAGQYAIPQIDPSTLERIEVLRGPSSVLYGQDSPGGIINLVTKRPGDEAFHEIQLQAGSFNRFQGSFDLGGPLDAGGTWSYRLNGMARDADTQVNYTKDQRISISPAVTWRPGADTTLTLLANYQQDPSGGYFGFVPAQGSFLFNPYGRIARSFYDGDPGFDRFRRKQLALGYLFEHRLNDAWTLRQNLRYQHVGVDWGRVASRGLQPNLRILNRQVVTDDERLDGITVDNQAQVRFRTGALAHTALFGLDYQYGVNDYRLGAGAAPGLDIVNPVYGVPIATPPIIQSNRQAQSQLGIYAQDQIRLGQLALLFGGRQDWADSRTTDRLANRKLDQSDAAFTGRAGAVWLFDNGLAPYVSYATSFQPTAGTDFAGQPFKPTTARQYEAGLKFQPTGFNSFATLSAFDLTQRNVTTADPLHPNFSVQTGEVRSRGIEFEVRASLADGLNLAAAYTHMDPKVTRSNGADQGKRPIGIPRDLASLWVDYTPPAGGLAGFGFGGGVRYVGATAGNAANTYEVPSFTLVDATVTFDLGRLDTRLAGGSVALNAANLFDKQYVASCNSAPNNCYYGLGRSVIGTVAYRW